MANNQKRKKKKHWSSKSYRDDRIYTHTYINTLIRFPSWRLWDNRFICCLVFHSFFLSISVLVDVNACKCINVRTTSSKWIALRFPVEFEIVFTCQDVVRAIKLGWRIFFDTLYAQRTECSPFDAVCVCVLRVDVVCFFFLFCFFCTMACAAF